VQRWRGSSGVVHRVHTALARQLGRGVACARAAMDCGYQIRHQKVVWDVDVKGCALKGEVEIDLYPCVER
jgi:hypothetical protein